MSLLASVARAGPSQSMGPAAVLCRALPTKGTVEARRHAARQAGAPSQAGYIQKGDGKDKLRRKIPEFKQLPTAQLNNRLFNPETIGNIERPAFKGDTARNPASLGKALQLATPGPDPLRIFGLPRKLNFEFRVLTKPYTVVRKITQETLALLAAAKKTSSVQNRVVLTGRAGSGKSFLMLQAVEHCVQDGWIVIYIPRGINLVNSTTSYTYNIRTQTYLQPAFSFQTLQRMLSVNRDALAAISLSEDLILEKQTVPKGTRLTDVIEIAIAERNRTVAQSPAILEAVMKALEVQEKYPVLLAVDDFQALYGKTTYRDPHFLPIQSYHLSLPRMIMEYASGKRNFTKGAVLGALSLSQTNYPLPLELRDALELQDLDAHPISPYLKRSKDMMLYTEGLQKLEVPEKLTLQEATGIFEVWKGRNAIGHSNTFYDEMFLSKYTESSGNARDFVWKGLLGTLDV